MNRNKKIGQTFIRNEITNSFWINRFINKLTKNGNKKSVENNFYKLFLKSKSLKLNFPLHFFYCLEILRPVLILRNKTKGGRVNLIPTQISLERQYDYSLTWLVHAINKDKLKNLSSKIFKQILKISILKRSKALSKKRKIYKKLVKNRFAIHFKR